MAFGARLGWEGLTGLVETGQGWLVWIRLGMEWYTETFVL